MYIVLVNSVTMLDSTVLHFYQEEEESMGTNDPRVWCRTILTYGPRGMVGRIYLVNHYVLLHTKYRSCRSMVSKDFLESYSLIYGKSMEAKYPEGLANLEPRDMVGMIYVGDHQTLLYTKYISCGSYIY